MTDGRKTLLQNLYDFFMDWICESPSEIIPNNEQIAQVLKILEEHTDPAELSKIIATCREYLEIK
jgi:hypothetical protein